MILGVPNYCDPRQPGEYPSLWGFPSPHAVLKAAYCGMDVHIWHGLVGSFSYSNSKCNHFAGIPLTHRLVIWSFRSRMSSQALQSLFLAQLTIFRQCQRTTSTLFKTRGPQIKDSPHLIKTTPNIVRKFFPKLRIWFSSKDVFLWWRQWSPTGCHNHHQVPLISKSNIH